MGPRRQGETAAGFLTPPHVQGIGGSASNIVAGLLVVSAGYTVAFSALAGIAAAAFLLILLALPETRPAS